MGPGAAKGAPQSVARFPKSLRLRRRTEFLRIQREGVKVSTDSLLGLALNNSQGLTRLGITVSNKVGNAVVRNRIRRRLREIFRRYRDSVPRGLDLVLIATLRARDADFSSLKDAYCAIAEKLRKRFL